ncbi:hypothetical protein FKM82_006665 [Ascaphus truei]
MLTLFGESSTQSRVCDETNILHFQRNHNSQNVCVKYNFKCLWRVITFEAVFKVWFFFFCKLTGIAPLKYSNKNVWLGFVETL